MSDRKKFQKLGADIRITYTHQSIGYLKLYKRTSFIL